MNNEIPVFGMYYKDFDGKTDLIRHSMVFNINDLKTKKDVLQWYIQMNDGGTPHSKEEIERVKQMMEEEK